MNEKLAAVLLKQIENNKQASTTKEAISGTALRQIATGVGGLGLGTGIGSLLAAPKLNELSNTVDVKNEQLRAMMDYIDNQGVSLKDTDASGLTKELLNRGKAKLEDGADAIADKYHNVVDAVTAPENRTKVLVGTGAGALGIAGLAALWANRRKRKQEEKQASTTKEASRIGDIMSTIKGMLPAKDVLAARGSALKDVLKTKGTALKDMIGSAFARKGEALKDLTKGVKVVGEDSAPASTLLNGWKAPAIAGAAGLGLGGGLGYAGGVSKNTDKINALSDLVDNVTQGANPALEDLSTADMINQLKHRGMTSARDFINAGKAKFNDMSTTDKLMAGTALTGGGLLAHHMLQDKRKNKNY